MLWNKNLALFAPQSLGEIQHRSLLVQFLLFEVFECYRALQQNRWEALLTAHPRFFPYDWALATGHLNKLQEHTLLLESSFPGSPNEISRLQQTLGAAMETLLQKFTKRKATETLRQLYRDLEPFIERCRDDENLLSFLLKHRRTVDNLTQEGHLHQFLLKLHPEGLETLGEKMCDQYHQRGFFSQIPEFKLLLTELIHV